MPQYLSTDPNAGLAPAPTKRKYLSMDPNAGAVDTAASAPSSTVEIEEPPSLMGKVGNFVERAGHILGSTGDATATTIDQLYNKKAPLKQALGAGFDALKDIHSTTTNFSDVLKNAGKLEDDPYYARSIAGFAGDVLIDPLNLIGAAPVKALSKAGVKLPSAVAKVAGGSDELSGAVTRMLKTAGTALEEVPLVKDAVAQVVQFPGTGRIMSNVDPTVTYRDLRRLQASKDRHASELAADIVTRIAPKMQLKDAEQIALHLADGAPLDAKLAPQAQQFRHLLDQQVAADLKAGSILRAPQAGANYVPRYATKFDNSNPNLTTILRGTAKENTVRKVNGLTTPATLKEAADQQGALLDIREIAARRVADGEKANRNIEFMDLAAKHFGKNTAEKGYRTLDFSYLKDNFHPQVIKKLEGTWFPERVAADLERTTVLSSKESDASKLVNSASKLWKSLTLVPPGHQFTNFLGNVANMHVGGMSLPTIAQKYTKAQKWARMLNDPQVPAWPRFGVDKVRGDFGIGKYQNWEIAKAAKEYEIIGTATQLGELEQAGDALKMFKGDYNPLNYDNKALKTVRKLGQRTIEEPARLAFFVDQLEQGKTLEQAALRTKEVLFDYGELTELERKVRLGAVPFYTWTRKNLPFYMKSLLTSPERIEKHKDVLQLFENAGEGEEFTQPEFLTDNGYVPSPIRGENDTPGLMRVALPMHDLNLIPNGLGLEDLQKSGGKAAGMLAPWLKVPAEMFVAKRELQSGIPIQRSQGVATPSPLGNLAHAVGADKLPLVGGLLDMRETPLGLKQGDTEAYLTRQVPGLSWMANAIPGVREDDPITMDKLPPIWKTLGTILGLNPQLVNPRTQQSEMQNRMTQYKERVKRSLEP